MAVFLVNHVEAIRTDTSDPYTFVYTPLAVDAAPEGIALAAVHGVTSIEHVLSITYGGVAMTKIVSHFDGATELGRAQLWFLGSGIPTGAQTVSADLDSATGDDIHFVLFEFSGDANLEVIDSDGITNDLANPTRTLQAGGKTKISIAAMYGGGAAPGGTLAAGNTLSQTHDFGAFMSQSCYETTVDAADHTIGWSTLGIDDLAFVCMAISEVFGGAAPNKPLVAASLAAQRASRW